jgi:DNA polymerase III epsilon subunit-like protein
MRTGMSLLFLDTETTDIGENARLIQLAYRDSNTGESVNEYFKPPVAISFGAMAVHHITPKMVAGKPPFQDSAAQKKLLELVRDHLTVAHNAPFDVKILKNEGVEVDRYIDTLRVAKHLIPGEQYNLQYLRYSLNLDESLNTATIVPHDAMGDVVILESLFEYLSNVIQEKFALGGTDEIIKKMLELTHLPILLQTLNFGKYINKTFQEVSQNDRGYLEWLLGSESKKNESNQNEDLIYTLRHYLNN